ncbi:putative transcription factor C2H2 family [Medicago truncatula]|uniref:C3HC4-type RING zinc finger protein n=1 Tax=Medicago truncatula TaxID=3880 RepID=G7J361_MEDTR|nr:probable E3 ubiquitin-protein ligase XERICO [Medicago truncatula]AES72154.1 C3HC4-type RING zinc finger protein [Medicago truncatula]RHN69336.1 putative transcription factor C2H2 family [Medicago truncatula]
MGLSNFPYAAEGVVPVIVMNTVLSMVLLKNMFRSMLQVVGCTSTTNSSYSPNIMEELEEEQVYSQEISNSRERRVSITQYKFLCYNRSNIARSSSSCGWTSPMVECCVCLSGFEANQEVSELPCKHFFHRGCLDKWFDNKHSSCPLCRSMD